MREPATESRLDYPHIEKPLGDSAHLRRLPRVRVAHVVMDYLTHGWSPEEMCRQHPSLRLAEAYAAMAYYYDHQREVDEEIAGEVAEAAALGTVSRQSPFARRMKLE